MLLLLVMAAATGCRPAKPVEQPPPVVLYAEARALTGSETWKSHTYLGMVRGEMEIDLSFKVSGLIESIGDAHGDWHEGDPVARGQPLARLKQGDFRAALDQTEANARFAGQRWTNNHQLFFAPEPAISRQEWEKTDAEFKGAQADRERAWQALQDSQLLAPFDGKVLARLANSGEMVQPGKLVLRFAKVQPFVSIELGVPDRVLAQVRKLEAGRTNRVRITALDQTEFTGVVSEIGEGAKEGSRLFRVVVKVRNDRDLIKSGMTASVTFDSDASPGSDDLLVPLSALVAASDKLNRGNENQLAVFVVRPEGRVEERLVWTGDLVRSSIIVTNNPAAPRSLVQGDPVVVVGASQLRDGMRVDARPVRATPGTALPRNPPPAPRTASPRP